MKSQNSNFPIFKISKKNPINQTFIQIFFPQLDIIISNYYIIAMIFNKHKKNIFFVTFAIFQ